MRIFSELLFLHGHIADVELARRLAGVAPPPPDTPAEPVTCRDTETGRQRRPAPALAGTRATTPCAVR